jgi:RNA polymerase-interacting CarD/CdnL/TRCF family regulator
MVNQAEIRIGDGSLRIGDRVVYPNQGICRITGVDVKQIAGQQLEFVSLAREEDGATVMVPSTKVMGIGLRKVANVDAIDEVFDYLASPSDDPQLDWKVRHRENADKMTGGGLFGTVEVLKGLHALSRVRPLPQKERELYDSARHLIVGEIAAAMGIPVGVAENNLDYALFPPPGMKRKGKELLPAAIPATAGPLRRDEDDDLGFDDEAGGDNGESGGEAATKARARPTEDEEEEDLSEPKESGEAKVMAAAKLPLGARPAAAGKAAAAPGPRPVPKAAAAPGPRPVPKAGPAAAPKHAPKPAARPAATKAAPKPPMRPAPASKAAKARPAAKSKPATKLKGPAKKAAAKKPAAKKGKR